MYNIKIKLMNELEKVKYKYLLLLAFNPCFARDAKGNYQHFPASFVSQLNNSTTMWVA